MKRTDDHMLMHLLKTKIELDIKDKRMRMRQELCEAKGRMLRDRVALFTSLVASTDQNETYITNIRRRLLSEICDISYLNMGDE